jgi:hypothetical protein
MEHQEPRRKKLAVPYKNSKEQRPVFQAFALLLLLATSTQDNDLGFSETE